MNMQYDFAVESFQLVVTRRAVSASARTVLTATVTATATGDSQRRILIRTKSGIHHVAVP